MYNIDATLKYNHSAQVTPLDADSARQILVLPTVNSLTSTYFLQLLLSNGGTLVSNNFYWLSTTADVPNFSKSTWYNTPCSQYADFTLLQKLPQVTVAYSFTTQQVGSNTVLTATVSNPTTNIAFFIHLQVVDKSTGANILPVFWDDNYITLVPKEMRAVNVTFSSSLIPSLRVDWWNDGSN